jgi:hypothetical protein
MTTPSTPRKAGPLLGTGAQTSWPFTFKVFAASDIAVTIADSLGVETALVLGSDYSVTLNANQETSPGGTVTYPISGAALPVGKRLVIIGNLPYDQPLDLPSGGNFSPLALENQLDRMVMQIQQLRENVGRALQVSVSTNTDVTLPPPAASQLIGWDATGENLENVPLSELGTAIAYGTYRYDTFTGDGTTTNFALSEDPAVLANLDVSISGVVQVPGTDYSLVTGNLVFTSAPSSGTAILARYGQALTALPDSDQITFVQAGAGAVTRTMQNKLREYVSVTDFGAVGDCVYNVGTNNTVAFQEAIDYCLENSKALFVPQGNYLVTGSLFINGTRGGGAQATFRMFGELASDAITHSPSAPGGTNGVIVSRTNITFDANNDNLFEIAFDDFFFENVSFEDLTVRMPQNGANFKTSVGFSVEKNTGNYVSKLLWQNVNCYGLKSFIRFFRTAGNPANDQNYFGFTYLDRCNTFNTEAGIVLDNVNMNTFYLDRCIFHAATVDGGIHVKGSAGFINMRNTHFEGCEPAAFNFTTSNWGFSLGLDNVSAESTGRTSGYGYIKPFVPTFGYSGLRVFVSNFLYPPAFMPAEFRLPFGASISAQCPVKVSGHGWIAKTPQTITPVVSNNATFNQTEKYTFFLTQLSSSIGRKGAKLLEKSIAGSNAGVGRTPYSGSLPHGIKERCVGINSNGLINNNTETSQVVADGYVYGSFAARCTDTNNGFATGTVTVGGVNIALATGFTWEPFTGIFTFVAPIETGDFLSTCDVTLYQSTWRTPIYFTFEPELLTAAEAAVIYPKANRYDNSVANGATLNSSEFGQLNVDYAVRVRHTFNGGAKGIHEYIVRGNGTTAGRVHITTLNSLAAGITVALDAFPTDENLYDINITNATGSLLYVTREVEYLS